ncbi:MAG TPA: hypothetical protein VEK08_15040, partial [Planctomycetota bacterium]|nr:hypothetical protein [Planctomycetota bacterium]
QDIVAGAQVLRTPDGGWRMYYWHHQAGWGRVNYLYTVAQSSDGLRWHVTDYERPALISHFYRDQNGLTDEQRLAEKSQRSNDANFVYFNPRLGCYEQFSPWLLDAAPDRRVEEDNCPWISRMIQRRVSADGLEWSPPELVVQSDARDPWDQQFYHMAVQYHEDWLIGSLGHYRAESGQQSVDLELVFSRDGRKWERPIRGGFIPREPGGRDAEGIYPGNAWIDLGNEWLCLYTAYARKHSQYADERLPKSCIAAARWPKHRFVGLRAEKVSGGFLTPVFYPRSAEIRIDADIRGWLKAELCDAWGRKLDGYHLQQSIALTVDSPSHVLRWRNAETSKYTCDPVRLRFEFSDADVYSVCF